MVEKFIILKQSIGRNKLNELKVSIGYQKENINPWNGDRECGGCYVYLKPIKRNNGIISCTMLSASTLENGFKICIFPMARKSTKKLEKIGDLITVNVLEKIRESYEAQDFQNVINILRNLPIK